MPAAVIAAAPRPAQAGDRRLQCAHVPEVPAAHRAAGVRRKEIVLPRGRNVRVQRAVVRAVVLHLRMTKGPRGASADGCMAGGTLAVHAHVGRRQLQTSRAARLP